MTQNRRTIGNNMLWNSVGSLFYMGSQWLFTVVVVRLSGNYSDAGILSLAMSISTPLAICAMLNLRTFQVADVDERFHDKDFIGTRIISSSAAFLCCVLFVLWQDYQFYTTVCIILFMILRLSEAMVDVFHGIAQKAWRLDIAGKSFLMRGFFILLGCIVGEYFFHSLAVSILIMNICIYAELFLYDFFSCKRYIDQRYSASVEKIFSLIKIGIPLGSFAVLLNLMPSIPRLFLGYWHGEEILGIFSSIANITLLVPQMVSFVYNPIIPIFSDRWKQHDINGFCRLLVICVLVTLLISILAIFAGFICGEWVLVLVFGESIRPYCALFCPVLFTASLTAFTWLLSSILIVLGGYNILTVLTAISTAFCVLASMILIRDNPFWGIVLVLNIGLGIECILLTIRLLFIMKG